MRWAFKGFELDADAFELRKGGEPVSTEPQVLSLLILLVENRNRLVTKDEIVERIWDGRAISDAAISSRIKSARQLIDDDGKQQNLIRTVHGRGFRFVGEVESADGGGPQSETTVSPPSAAAPAGAEVASRPGSRRNWMLVAGLALVSVITLSLLAYLYGNPSGKWATNDHSVAVAVIPFSSPAEDGDQGREIAAAIVTGLSDRTDFAMLSSTSSFSLADRGMTVAQIASELGATHILEGDLRGSGEKRRLDLRLVEGSTQRQIWSGTVQNYPADANNILGLAVRRTAAVVQAYLEVGAGRVDIPDGTSPDAIREYRRGLEIELATIGRDPLLSRQQFFGAAREKAPGWADAHGAFAWSTLFARPETLALEYEEQHALIREAIARSLQIDPDNRWARLTEAVHMTRYGTDLAAALELHRELAEDEPNWPLALKMYAQALLIGGHYREAVAQFDQIDALNALPTHNGKFIRSYALRGIGRAMNSRRLALDCEARCFWYYHGWYEAILLAEFRSSADFEAALDTMILALDSSDPQSPAREVGFAANTGEMMAETARFLRGSGSRPEQEFGLVSIPALVAHKDGDLEGAMAHLEQLNGDWIPANAIFELLYDDGLRLPDEIRADPRYHEIMARPHFKAVLDHRAANGQTAGAPIDR